MNVIERIRRKTIEGLFGNSGTMPNCWKTWRELIMRHIGSNPTPQSILDLGDHLREIFQSTGAEGRSQSGVSGAGYGWEAFITWYVNLCCVGTRTVAIKNGSQIPSPILDSMTVNYSSYPCNTEPDITVIVFPDDATFTDDNDEFIKANGEIDMDKLNLSVTNAFSSFQVGIIQCKTNWNDTAQIPMLWDMVYSAGGFRGRQISVGKNGFSIQQLSVFTYSFVTLPSNKLEKFKPTSLCVHRVYNISGGNYWGVPSQIGVARSVKEIFQNYRDGYEHQDIRRTLINAIPRLSTDLSYFNLY